MGGREGEGKKRKGMGEGSVGDESHNMLLSHNKGE